jgi:hypothetical protein
MVLQKKVWVLGEIWWGGQGMWGGGLWKRLLLAPLRKLVYLRKEPVYLRKEPN